MSFKPLDAYYAVELSDGSIVSNPEAFLDPNSIIVISYSFELEDVYIGGRCYEDGRFEHGANLSIFRQKLDKYAAKTIEHFREKLLDGPIDKFAGFSKFTMPLIKRAYPALLASQLMAVQPMRTTIDVSYTLPTFTGNISNDQKTIVEWVK